MALALVGTTLPWSSKSSPDMIRTFRRRVAFSETDASGRAHFTNFLKWVEDAEHQLLEELGVPVCADETGWPRAKVECHYRLPLTAGETAEVALELARLGKTSLTWQFRILRSDAQLAAEGTMVTVLTGASGPLEITEEVRSRLEGE